MPWRGPREDDIFEFPSLGWSLLDWWSNYLPSPNDPDEPLVFTRDQALTLVEWYAIDPRSGRFVFRRGCSRRSKGIGKSPIEGAKAIAEFVADVRFDGWDADGEPVGRPWGTKGDPPAMVQIAAVSEDQTENTYGALHDFLAANDGAAADALRVDVGLTRCYLRDSPGKLEPVTASAGSREGQRVTYGVLDESHLWTPRNGGVRLAQTLRRNVAKMGGRTYETTNSFVPGEESVAEGTHAAYEKGAPGIFMDAVEAPEVKEEDSDEKLRAALAVAYGDAYWVDLDRLVADIRDPETTWEDAGRFYFNWNMDDRRKAVEKKAWARAQANVAVPSGAYIGVGFDGSISDDCTALIGCIPTDTGFHLFEIEIWARPANAPRVWRIPRTEVQERRAETFDTYTVGRMMCDPPKWQTEIEAWAEEHGEDRVVMFDTNVTTRMAKACDRFLVEMEKGTLTHDGSPTLTAHILNMFKRKVRVRDEDDDGRTKFVFVKGADRTAKIDGGIGAVLALEAAATMPVEAPKVAEAWAFYR